MHKLQWKHIYRINSSMHIKKVMWVTSGPILFHSIWNVVLVILKCLKQSLSAKWFSIITSQNRHKFIIGKKKKRPTVASPTAANDLILGDIWRQFIRTWQICHHHLAEWKWCFICKRFKRYPSFAHKLNAQLDRSIATDVKWKILQIDQRTGSSYHSPTEEVL